jgi:hypothetical protein
MQQRQGMVAVVLTGLRDVDMFQGFAHDGSLSAFKRG